MQFQHATPVRYSDLDAMGHVNNVRFLTFIEEARIAFLGRLDDDGADTLMNHIILARQEFDYVRPVRLTRQPIEVSLWVSKIGGSSFTLDYVLKHKGAVVGRGRTVAVRFGYDTGRSEPLTDADRAALEQWRDDADVVTPDS